MPITTRTFRVFVSSTFEDLKEERNALQRQVFPRLSKICESHGARFQAIDLRWGIREEAGLDQKTMEICLAEIERCQRTKIKPNFIVLLGGRYGWRPLPARVEAQEFATVRDQIPNDADRLLVENWYQRDDNAVPPEYLLKPRTGEFVNRDRWEEDEQRMHGALREAARAFGLANDALFKYEASATHQEILKGLGSTPKDCEHVFAFFRTDDESKEDPDLQALKRYLRDRLGKENVFAYDPGDYRKLCDDVAASLTKVIEGEASRFKPRLSLDLEIDAQDAFAIERGRHFTGRKSAIDAIDGYLKSKDPRPLVLHGPSGSGKSAIMAKASAPPSDANPGIIRRFIGASPDSSSGLTLLRSLCQQIDRRYGRIEDAPASFDEVVTAFRERLALSTAEQPLVLFIDALDHLRHPDPAAIMTWLPSELPPHCRVVISTIEVPHALRNTRLIEVEPFPVEEAEEALSQWLDDAHRKLQLAQREKLIAAFHRCGLPLYLRLAFEEARRWRSFDQPEKCVLGEGLAGIIDGFFDRLSEQGNHGPVLVSRSLSYLTAARYGLAEDEMLDVLTKDDAIWNDFISRAKHEPPERRLPVAVWSRLYLDLEEYLTERDAQGATVVAFYHRQLSERFTASEGEGRNRDATHRRLADLFRTAGDPQEDSSWLGSRRGMAELPFHLAASGQQQELQELLLAIPYLDARCNYTDVHGLLTDFGRLAAPDEAAREMNNFIFVHAQRLETKREVLFGLIQHEGPAAARQRSERLLLSKRWNNPWLRTTPVRLPVPAANEAGMDIKVVAQHNFDRSAATSLSETLEVAFYLKRLGRVGIIDAQSMRELPEAIVIPAFRVLGLFASADGRFLAVAFESGDLALFELEFSVDRALLKQQEQAFYRYLVPESEPPVMRWNGDQILFQRQDGRLAMVEHTREEIVPLPSGSQGELSGAVFTHGEWVVMIRQASDTWIWRCGSDDKLAVLAADVTSAACGEDGTLVIGLSDRTVRTIQTSPELRHSSLLETEYLPVCVGIWKGRVVWAEQEGLRYWDPKQGIARPLEDDETLVGSTLFLRLGQISPSPRGDLLVLGDYLVCRIELMESIQTASYSVDKALVDAGGAIYAIQKRSQDLWLVNCSEQKELRLVPGATVRHFHVLDGHGHLLTIGANGGGVLTDLTSHVARRIEGPLALNSAVVHKRTFWLADRLGGVYQLTENYALTLECKVNQQGVSGGRLSALENWIVWQGKSTAVTADNPYADSQDCLLFFRLSEHPSHLREVELRSFPKENGRLQLITGGGGREELLAIFHGHSQFALCAKIGTPEAFLKGEERSVPMDFDSSILDCVTDTEDNALYLCCGNQDLVVVDLETMRTHCRLTASRPFTAVAGNGHRGVVAVEADKRLYQCRMERPSHAETI